MRKLLEGTILESKVGTLGIETGKCMQELLDVSFNFINFAELFSQQCVCASTFVAFCLNAMDSSHSA